MRWKLIGAADEKRALRSLLLAARRELPAEELLSVASRLRDVVLAAPEVAAATTVAAYFSVGAEPGTGPLLDALLARGARVLLPILSPDNDVDWAEYAGPESLRPAGRGLLEPSGPRLGRSAVIGAQAVVVPGLAADRRGMRLGRGGGSYDRVLARTGSAFTVVLLHDGEVVDIVPADPHDRPVAAAATPGGLIRFPV
jgi:5-formyltetrahydrofolate cyclo-ligase